MTTPVSFITVDHTSLMCGNLSHASGTHSVASPKTFPTSLISDALQSSLLKPMQFRCRVTCANSLDYSNFVYDKHLYDYMSHGFMGARLNNILKEIMVQSVSCLTWDSLIYILVFLFASTLSIIF